MTTFDVAVVGRGLIGSAAARHLAESGSSAALIGAGEPADYSAANGPFASHYDAGRIAARCSESAIWAELTTRSMSRYADIQERSGVPFHDGRGFVRVAAQAEQALAHGVARGAQAELVDRDWLFAQTGIAIRSDHPGRVLYERGPAGVINPRALLRAQSALAEVAGAVVVAAPATSIRPLSAGFEIEAGQMVRAKRIVLATGAYGASLVGVDLALERRLRTIVLADLGRGETAPTLVDGDPSHPDLDEVYWVPPVRFPDGRTLLKIGGNSLPMITAENTADIDHWFQAGGSKAETGALQAMVRELLPTAEIVAWDHKPCVVTYTRPELPYIGFVDDGVIVALGASGSGAQSSDELGRLTATLAATGTWSDPVLEAASFAPQFTS